MYPANVKESLIILRHIEKQQKLAGVSIRRVALDRGYDTGAVHRGLELLGVEGFIAGINFPNTPAKYGFAYRPEQDCFICPEGHPLHFHRLNCNKSTGKYLRCYQTSGHVCQNCKRRNECLDRRGLRRRILASSCYPAFYRGHQRIGTPEYYSMMRLRKIWAEGSFAVLKREHLMQKILKHGLSKAAEECTLATIGQRFKFCVFSEARIEYRTRFFAQELASKPAPVFCTLSN